jgi:predicted Zn-dependent protease
MIRFWTIVFAVLLVVDGSRGAEPDDPIGRELRALLLDDQTAQDRVDELIASNNAFKLEGAGLSNAIMATKIRQLIDPVREEYEKFLERNPRHVRAHLALASFLQEFGDQINAKVHMDTALQIAPNDPVALNNLGNYYGEFGPPAKAFEFYQRAAKAAPDQSMYLRNLASVMVVHNEAARAYFSLATDQDVVRRALIYFQEARTLNPSSFLLNSTLAQTYYQLKPLPYKEAVAAWEAAMMVAGTRMEKEGVMIHLARIHIQAKNFDAARYNLNGVSEPLMLDLKRELRAKIPRKMEPVSFSTSTAPPTLFNLSSAPPPSTNATPAGRKLRLER